MNTKASEYFLAHCPDSGPERPMYNRIINALSRRGNITMNELCGMSEKEIKKIRSIGKKACFIVMEECRNYLNEISENDEE